MSKLTQQDNDDVLNDADSAVSVSSLTPTDWLLTTQANIEKMLDELKFVDEHVYEQIQWSNGKPDFTLINLYSAIDVVDEALRINKVEVIDETRKALYVLMIIASLPMKEKIYSRLYIIFCGSGLSYKEKYHVKKHIDSISSLLTLANAERISTSTTVSSDLSGIEKEISKVVNMRVEAALKPVSMLCNLVIKDHEYLSSLSPTLTKTKIRQQQASIKSAGRSLNHYTKIFKNAINAALEHNHKIAQQLKDVRVEKQSQIRALKKELSKAHEMVRNLQSNSDPLSNLFGLDVSHSKDEEIARLTLQIEQLETRNYELQRENTKLYKEKSNVVFSDN